jgi:hypothetical protein
MGRYELDSSRSGQGPVEGSYEHSKEPSGSIKCWETLVAEWLEGSQEGLSYMKLVS